MKSYKYPGFFQSDNPLQMANKKKLIELMHERVTRVIDRNVVSHLNYSTRAIVWIETELARLGQKTANLLKEKGELQQFCNNSRL